MLNRYLVTRFCTNSSTKQFSNAKMYVMQYKYLKVKVKEQQKQISGLRQKVETLQDIARITLGDRVKRALLALINIKYDTKKVQMQKQKLRNYRVALEQAIEESEKKWQQPREVILQNRQQIINSFVEDLLQVEKHLDELNREQTDEQLKEAVQLSHRYLINTLLKEKVEQISPQSNTPFNQQQHDIVNGEGTGKVVQVLQTGWKLKGKVIRKAKVSLQ